MPKKKFLVTDPITGKLSRLKAKDLPLMEIDGLDEGDPVAPFGNLESDLIEYVLYTVEDDYIASGEIRYPLPENLDVGQYVRDLGYNRGTYKVVFNFLREIGGSTNAVLVKKSDKSIYTGEWMIDTDGRILASYHDATASNGGLVPLLDDYGNEIELKVADNKYWIQKVSPSRTELRLRPNPAIDDPAYHEQFRLLGYTCLSYSDISGESYITFTDVTQKNAKINVSEGQTDITLNELMVGGTLIVRDAFIIGWDDIPEQLSRYAPIIETEQLPISENLVVNGHFKDGEHAIQIVDPTAYPVNEIVEFSNPGHSKYCLQMTSVDGVVGNQYRMRIENLIPGETYVLSCWVMWDSQWDSLTDQGIFFIKKADGTTNILPYQTVGLELEEKIVDGNTWKRLYERFTADEDTIYWILGYNNGAPNGNGNTAGYRYFTDIQLEPGSGVSLPTPYMIHPITEETDVPVTGHITFEGDNIVKATLSDGDVFVEEMAPDVSSNGGGRGSGKITIKNAVVIDEQHDISTERTVIDNIPVENADNSSIREGGYETEFHQSPFHGSTSTDSNELNITLMTKEEYHLYWLSGSYDGSNLIHSPHFVGKYEVPEEVREIDELTLSNQNGMQVRIKEDGGTDGEEGKFHYTRSQYHGDGSAMDGRLTILIQCDNEFQLFKVSADETITPIQSSKFSDWRTPRRYHVNDFSLTDRLVMHTYNISGPAAFAAKIDYLGATYRTGDTLSGKGIDPETGDIVDLEDSGLWKIVARHISGDGTVPNRFPEAGGSNPPHSYDSMNWEAFADVNEAGSSWGTGNHPELAGENSGVPAKWIWNEGANQMGLTWEWYPAVDIRPLIWNYPDPGLYGDAIYPVGWSAGYQSWNWGSPSETGAEHPWWRTQWLGYHAKWTREGRSGGNTIKFIDQNSMFQNPNHPDYTGKIFNTNSDGTYNHEDRRPDGTIDYAYGTLNGYGWNESAYPSGYTHATGGSLQGRPMFVNQWLPLSLAAQGIQHGDRIKISWWQKSEVVGKGANVYIRWWRNDWQNLHDATNFATNFPDSDLTPGTDEAAEYEYNNSSFWTRYTTSGWNSNGTKAGVKIGVTEAGVWEKVEYTFKVDPKWDLQKTTHQSKYGDRNVHALIRIHGEDQDIEGILWVEDVKLTFVDEDVQPEVDMVWTVDNFQPGDKLKVTANKKVGTNDEVDIESGYGFISKVEYKGAIYKTGDPDVDHYMDTETNTLQTVQLPGSWKLDETGTIRNKGNPEINEGVPPVLEKSEWIWPVADGIGNEESSATFIWTANNNIVDFIWNYPDPSLRTDAVWPDDWSNGFYNFNPNNNSGINWHTGWVGHHAKFVQNEGRDGETCMKFIDQNSIFTSPNHETYTGDYPSWEGVDGEETSANQGGVDSLIHRPMWLSQTLPHTHLAQGFQVGDKIRISWRQKSDTVGKGAQVGLLHYSVDDIGANTRTMTWGSSVDVHHPAPAGQEATWLEPSNQDWLNYIPVAVAGEWKEVSYDVVVDEDYDLYSPSMLYVYGNYGPEGMLWVENLRVDIVLDTDTITTTPVFGDLIGEISNVDVDENTITLTDTYGNLAQVPNESNPLGGYESDNDANIRSWSTFSDFYVDYTSSLSSESPIFGSLRGEINSVSSDTITLVKSWSELAEEAGHNPDERYPLTLSDMQTWPDDNPNGFEKWFIQYPMDESVDLGKLVRQGTNDFNLISNFKVDQTTYPEYPYSLVYKLYEPLSDVVQEHDFISIVREMIPPIEETCTLIPFIEEWISDTVLIPPEPFDVNSPIGTNQTDFQSYESLTTTDDELKKRLEDEVLSGSLSTDINIDHSQFSNFVRFGSVEKRVRNFKYKLDLIEQYTDRSASLSGTSGSSAGITGIMADPVAGAYISVSGSSDLNSPYQLISGSSLQIDHWEKQRRETINKFDNFEKYMFKQSSSYSSESIGIFNDNAWPKVSGVGNYSDPYVLARTTQSIATNWYADQLTSASVYDRANVNRLRRHLPEFIIEDTENTVFLNFVDMIGHYFDDIWTFIKAMTDTHDKRDSLSEGIAKDLLKPIAQSLGWELRDGKDLVSLPRYIFGMEQTGSEKPWVYATTPERDISREIWSRIINNMPYFLKTKGTSRAIKGLISCYGIPSSMLRVMEYGGPKLAGQSPDFMITRKFTKALNFFGSTKNTYVQNDTWEVVTLGDGATNRTPDTVEFRFKAVTGSDQVLVRRGDDWAIRLKDNGSSDRYGNVSFMLSGSRGYQEVSSSELPVYDGEFWSVMLTRDSASGYHLSDNSTSQDIVYSLYTKKYDAGLSRIMYESSNSLVVCGSLGAISESYNASYTGSADTITIGGPESDYFGESFSGSMMEYRNWTTPLNEASFDNHVAAPISFDGNHSSASWTDLVTRYSFDDDKDLSVSANNWFQDVSADQSFTSSASPYNYDAAGVSTANHFSSVIDEIKMKVPNLGPSGKSANKVRIESDSLIDRFSLPKLKFGESIVIPAYDTAPIDSNKLGIYFSPSKAIDEDIISSMPNLDFDQYIGEPYDQYKEQYTGLVEARNLYWQKYSGPNNFWDYLRLLKYYDHSLFKQIKDLLPARANANVGILIEPTILERDKIVIGKKPTFEPEHWFADIDLYYVSESSEKHLYEKEINWSNEFGISPHTRETGSYVSASSNYIPLESELNFSHPFRVNFHTEDSGSFLSASSYYTPLESELNFSHPFRVNYLTEESGSFLSASSEYVPLEINMGYSDPYRVSWYTRESGSFISASAIYEDIKMGLNLHDPFEYDNMKQESGSVARVTADFSSLNPRYALSELASDTGSFVLKHILERPTLFNLGDRDESGWHGQDYYNATIQAGSQKSIREEVVMPRVEQNVLSRFNYETEYYYLSNLSASLGKYSTSTLVLSDLDNRWDEALGTDRLFYRGCVQTDASTVADRNKRYEDRTPAVEVIRTSPSRLVTTDSPETPLDVTIP